MINFNHNSIFNLKQISNDKVREEVKYLLNDDEEIVLSFQTIRDQLIFTNKRIISIDVQGITGIRKSFGSLPYSTIQYFSIQTKGFLELFPDAELYIMFANTFTAKFEFKGKVDIITISKLMSKYVLK